MHVIELVIVDSGGFFALSRFDRRQCQRCETAMSFTSMAAPMVRNAHGGIDRFFVPASLLAKRKSYDKNLE